MYETYTFNRTGIKAETGSTTRENPAARCLIEAMKKPLHLTDKDIEALNRSIKKGEIPIKFDSPFESDERENSE